MTRLRYQLLAALAGATLALPAAAQVADSGPVLLHTLFQDHGMLQRDRPIPVWGRAQPGETVTVTLGPNSAKVRADAGGSWRATLPAMTAGGPYTLTAITPRGARQSADDLLIGDVWLCSGQSNMEWPVSQGLNAGTEIAAANDGQMRILSVNKDAVLTPLDSFLSPVRWQAVSSGSIGDFSAACYFMGRDLRASQNVPIGLIDASWGGTAIDAWRSETSIAADADLKDRLDLLRTYRTDPAEGNRRWGAVWQGWWDRKIPNQQLWSDTGAEGWRPVPAFTNWESWGVPELASYNGIVWYRTEVEITAAQAAQPATLGISPIDEVDETWVNGQAVGTTYSYNAPRVYPVGVGTLKPGRNRITVAALDFYSNGGLYGPAEQRYLRFADGSSVPLSGRWEYRVTPGNVGEPPRAPWESNAGLSGIYNGMIAPLGNYGLKGVAWYQGETNSGEPDTYAGKLGAMMADWRKQFGQPALPFLVVQLAGYGPRNSVPQESGFAGIRDAQRRAVSAAGHAGLVVTTDLGEPNDIHPANKTDVGHRLARAARVVAYGAEMTPSGPEIESVSRGTAGLQVRFRRVDGALRAWSGVSVLGFEICGTSPGSCRFVDAKIVGPSEVVLSPGSGPSDRVRYCWGDSPVCNLTDASALPAGPFEVKPE